MIVLLKKYLYELESYFHSLISAFFNINILIPLYNIPVHSHQPRKQFFRDIILFMVSLENIC